MVRAIVAGERAPATLLALCDQDVIRRYRPGSCCWALRGTWDEEHLFGLRQAVEAWDFYQQQIAACDVAIEKERQELAAQKPSPGRTRGRRLRSQQA